VSLWRSSLRRSRSSRSSEAIGGHAWRSAIQSLDGEWAFGHDFLYGRQDGRYLNDPAAMFLRARLVMLAVFGLGTALVIFFWAYELWDAWAGALAVLLFCFDPNFIAHSGLVTADAGVTFLMTASVYFFWRWCP
jgi:dolichyl-phosphate-mannose--protein O-mannosyl transferase